MTTAVRTRPTLKGSQPVTRTALNQISASRQAARLRRPVRMYVIRALRHLGWVEVTKEVGTRGLQREIHVRVVEKRPDIDIPAHLKRYAFAVQVNDRGPLVMSFRRLDDPSGATYPIEELAHQVDVRGGLSTYDIPALRKLLGISEDETHGPTMYAPKEALIEEFMQRQFS